MAGKNVSVGQNQETYLTGNINISILGQEISIPIFVFRNDRRVKGSNQPHLRVYIKENGQLKEVGALWKKVKNGNGKKKSSQ